MDYQSILCEIKNSVAYMTLNRPKQYNSLTIQMSEEIAHALEQWKNNSEVKVIVLSATGNAFCTGLEMSPQLFNGEISDLGVVIEKYTSPIVELIRNMPKIVLCAVNGIAAGAGASLPLLCDITIAAKSASFTQIFSKIGLIPDCGATWYLPRLVGFAKAKALMLTGEKISATEAERIGMIYKVVEDDQLMPEVIQLAEHLATQATVGLALTKQAMNLTMQHDLIAQLKIEQELQSKAGQTEYFFEAVRAFIMKEKPNFKGR